VLTFGPFSLIPAERLLKKTDKPIALGGRALDMLIAVVERAGEVVTNRPGRAIDVESAEMPISRSQSY
jgi:DNA-binding winged helix-turn-helix (wHTH) protein